MKIRDRFEKIGQDQLLSRRGGGCISIFGIPFLIAGLFIILVSTGTIPTADPGEIGGWNSVLMFLMGAIFTAAGTGLAFGRSWIRIDATRRVLQKEWGLLVPMRGAEISLIEFVSIEINSSTSTESGGPDTYLVTLRSRSGKDIRLFGSSDYGASYEQAAMIGSFIQLPTEDRTTDHMLKVTPGPANSDQSGDTADESSFGAGQAPSGSLCTLEERHGEAVIFIPQLTSKPLIMAGIAIPFIIAAIAIPNLIAFFDRSGTPDPVGYLFLSFILLFFVLLPAIRGIISLRRSRKNGTKVSVSSHQIVIEKMFPGKPNSAIIPANEIIGIDYGTKSSLLSSAMNHRGSGSLGYPPPGWLKLLGRFARSRGITVKSRSGLFTFGAGLPDDELIYLYSLLKRITRPEVPHK